MKLGKVDTSLNYLDSNVTLDPICERREAPLSVGLMIAYVQNSFLVFDFTQLLRILKDYPAARPTIVNVYRDRSAPPKVIEYHRMPIKGARDRAQLN